MAAMLSLEEAQARLLALCGPLPVERVPVADALGRYLAEPLVAGRTQPPADVSAMDGYAVRAADLPGPWTLCGESAAGHPFAGQVSAGAAVRISTGALMPAGADTVVIQENCERSGDRIVLTAAPPSAAGAHVRRCGNDFAAGTLLLDRGTLLGPAQLALGIAAGHAYLPVRRRPRIVVIDSGDELAADPAQCALHQVPASNGVMLAALAAMLPVEVQRIGPVADRHEDLRAALEQSAGADLIVTSGGASVGDHDLVRPALERWGAGIDFWKVAIKPGKPLLVARREAQLVLGLPGNPVSSHVTAYLFLLPLLRALLGAATPLPSPIEALLAEPLAPGGARLEFLRGRWNGRTVTLTGNQDSGALAALAHSNAFVRREPGAPGQAAGTPVQAYLFANGGIA